jgi:hypothetical protein
MSCWLVGALEELDLPTDDALSLGAMMIGLHSFG